MATPQKAQSSQQFRLERSTVGDVTILTLHGVLDETFSGQKIADSIRTDKVIVSLRDIRRFASWGMAEWVNLLRALANHDLYLVECSTYAINQMNLVTGLLGQAKLVSFYTPYRCASCGEETDSLILIPQGRAAIKESVHGKLICRACGGSSRMDSYSQAMCQALADRQPYDVDDTVFEVLRDRFKYPLTPDASQFRAYRRASRDAAYLRLSGNLATLRPNILEAAAQGTTIVDLAGALYDPAELGPWREFVKGALARSTSLQLLDCPPGFLDHAVPVDDLGPKFSVRSFALEYTCPTCNTARPGVVDVAANLEHLALGTLPGMRCESCQAICPPPKVDTAVLRRLPARERDAVLEKFLAAARAEPATKLENCLANAPKPSTTKPARGARAVYAAAGLGALIIACIVTVLMILWDRPKQRAAAAPQNPAFGATDEPGATPAPRPDWIISAEPASALCHDAIRSNQLVCIGVSSFREVRSEAVEEANDAALDELVSMVGLRITNPLFKDQLLVRYSESRSKEFAALQASAIDRTSPAYAAALQAVQKTRKRVVELLRSSGGPAVPTQRSDWHWEQYAKESGSGTEELVFVRYDINLDSVKKLVELYGSEIAVSDSMALTAFPGLVWHQPDFAGGAILTKVEGPLAAAGLAVGDTITAVGDRGIADATGLAKGLEVLATSGSVSLTVAGMGKPARKVSVQK